MSTDTGAIIDPRTLTDGQGNTHGAIDRESAAVEELLRSIHWSVDVVRQERLMSGHSRRLELAGPHFAYLSAGSVRLRAGVSGTVVADARGDVVTPRAADAVDATLRLGPGDFLLLPRGAELFLQPTSDNGARLVTGGLRLDGGVLSPITQVMPATVFSCSASVRDNGHSGLLEMVDAELATTRPGGSAVLNRLVDLIVSATLRSWLESGCASAADWLVQLRDPRLRRVLEAIHAEPGTPWTVETLARVANTSRSQFAEVFRGAVGDTPARYLTRVRMRRAEELLLAGRPVGRIAYDLGYDSDEGFRRAFQRHTGSAPTSWLRSATAAAEPQRHVIPA